VAALVAVWADFVGVESARFETVSSFPELEAQVVLLSLQSDSVAPAQTRQQTLTEYSNLYLYLIAEDRTECPQWK